MLVKLVHYIIVNYRRLQPNILAWLTIYTYISFSLLLKVVRRKKKVSRSTPNVKMFKKNEYNTKFIKIRKVFLLHCFISSHIKSVLYTLITSFKKINVSSKYHLQVLSKIYPA